MSVMGGDKVPPAKTGAGCERERITVADAWPATVVLFCIALGRWVGTVLAGRIGIDVVADFFLADCWAVVVLVHAVQTFFALSFLLFLFFDLASTFFRFVVLACQNQRPLVAVRVAAGP